MMTPDLKDTNLVSIGAAIVVAIMLLFQLLGVDMHALIKGDTASANEGRIERLYEDIQQDRVRLEAIVGRVYGIEGQLEGILDRQQGLGEFTRGLNENWQKIDERLDIISEDVAVIKERISKTK